MRDDPVCVFLLPAPLTSPHACRPDGLFSFLSGVKSSEQTLERRIIVAQCLKDTGLLRFVCEMAKAVANKEHNASVAVSFYTVIVAEIIASVKTVSDELLRVLLPFITAGLKSGKHCPDYQVPYTRAPPHTCFLRLLS